MNIASLIAAAAIASSLITSAHAQYTPSQMVADCSGARGEAAELACTAYAAGARDALLSIGTSSLTKENIESGKGANVAGICVPMTARIDIKKAVAGVRSLMAELNKVGDVRKLDDMGVGMWLMASLRKMYPCK